MRLLSQYRYTLLANFLRGGLGLTADTARGPTRMIGPTDLLSLLSGLPFGLLLAEEAFEETPDATYVGLPSLYSCLWSATIRNNRASSSPR
jgi:hypothetical protein